MSTNILKNGKILIVDDEMANVRFLELILRGAGYNSVYTTTDARQVIALVTELQPDLVLLDLMMPFIDGFAIMQQLQPYGGSGGPPILVLTADAAPETKHRALAGGAKDFLSKPLDAAEVLLRIHNLLETRMHNVLLEQKVQERTQDLAKAQIETLQRLATAAEYRDDDTGLHTKRVGLCSCHLAEAVGCPSSFIDLIARAAPLHDVGKIGVPDAILLKPGKLTEEEFETMRHHTVIGAGILAGSTSPWLHLAEEIALSHHERWDGKGYPAGLKGEEIPLSGRIVAIADVFDALTHERPYKKAWSLRDAIAEINNQSGHQFDPALIEAFQTVPHERFI